MQYLISVIDDRTGSGTAEEMVAIDAFNDRLKAGGHWVYANGLGSPFQEILMCTGLWGPVFVRTATTPVLM